MMKSGLRHRLFGGGCPELHSRFPPWVGGLLLLLLTRRVLHPLHPLHLHLPRLTRVMMVSCRGAVTCSPSVWGRCLSSPGLSWYPSY
jgi:hypothetical protein